MDLSLRARRLTVALGMTKLDFMDGSAHMISFMKSLHPLAGGR
jgi:hypothetical protein